MAILPEKTEAMLDELLASSKRCCRSLTDVLSKNTDELCFRIFQEFKGKLRIPTFLEKG